MKKRRMNLGAVIASAVTAGAMISTVGTAIADEVADFYKGRNVTMLIGSGAGGGYDTYSRVLGRHMGRHIPGNPHIVPQNMPGGASIKAANYMYNVAPKDGTVFAAVFNTLPLAPIVGKKGPKFDVHKIAWIGSIGKLQNICATWHTSKTRSFADTKTRQTVVAATGATGNAAVYPTLFNSVLGTKFKVVQGYKASGARLAVTRGEADGICGMAYQTLLASNPAWFAEKKLNILAQIGLEPHPALKGVPMVMDMIKGGKDRDLLTFLMIPQEMGRPYAAAPGLPKARLAALRTAFAATMTDPAFLADAKRTRLIIEPIGGEQMTALVTRLGAMPKPTIAAAAKLLVKKKKKKR
jgi:tripartite-type tricarboxylate transporter receptor subunit TctC